MIVLRGIFSVYIIYFFNNAQLNSFFSSKKSIITVYITGIDRKPDQPDVVDAVMTPDKHLRIFESYYEIYTDIINGVNPKDVTPIDTENKDEFYGIVGNSLSLLKEALDMGIRKGIKINDDCYQKMQETVDSPLGSISILYYFQQYPHLREKYKGDQFFGNAARLGLNY